MVSLILFASLSLAQSGEDAPSSTTGQESGYRGVGWGTSCDDTAGMIGKVQRERYGHRADAFDDEVLDLWLPAYSGVPLGGWMGGSVSPFAFDDDLFRTLILAAENGQEKALCVGGKYSAFAFTVSEEAIAPTKEALGGKSTTSSRSTTQQFSIARGLDSYSSYSTVSTTWTKAGTLIVLVEHSGLPWGAAWVVYMSSDLPSDLQRIRQAAIDEEKRSSEEKAMRATEDALQKLE